MLLLRMPRSIQNTLFGPYMLHFVIFTQQHMIWKVLCNNRHRFGIRMWARHAENILPVESRNNQLLFRAPRLCWIIIGQNLFVAFNKISLKYKIGMLLGILWKQKKCVSTLFGQFTPSGWFYICCGIWIVSIYAGWPEGNVTEWLSIPLLAT